MTATMIPVLTFDAIPAFADNYIWLLARDGRAAVVDPGDAQPVLQTLAARELRLCAILVTHHHADHIGGLPELLRRFDVPVYGPAAEAPTIRRLTRTLRDGDRIELPELELGLRVIEVPGHTLGHIAYAGPDMVLCGDTLFSAGCGRLFEGTPQQMHRSLRRLAELGGETKVYCTHEYTLANLAFAHAVEPDNGEIAAYRDEVRTLRAQGCPSLPSSIARELAVNPFLRCGQPAVADAARRHGAESGEPVAVFAALRRWKDGFRTG